MSGNIFNSNGTRVGVVDGATIFSLNGHRTLSSKRNQYLSTFRRAGRPSKRGARVR